MAFHDEVRRGWYLAQAGKSFKSASESRSAWVIVFVMSIGLTVDHFPEILANVKFYSGAIVTCAIGKPCIFTELYRCSDDSSKSCNDFSASMAEKFKALKAAK